MVMKYAPGRVLRVLMCVNFSIMAMQTAAAQPVSAVDGAQPAAESAAAPADSDQGTVNAEIAQRLMTAGQPKKCEKSGPDGTIVVCGGREANEKERLPLRDQLESAKSTRDGLPRAPNVSGLADCSKGCIGFGSAPTPMYFFDITKLPEAPPDSDADRIARGEIRAP